MVTRLPSTVSTRGPQGSVPSPLPTVLLTGLGILTLGLTWPLRHRAACIYQLRCQVAAVRETLGALDARYSAALQDLSHFTEQWTDTRPSQVLFGRFYTEHRSTHEMLCAASIGIEWYLNRCSAVYERLYPGRLRPVPLGAIQKDWDSPFFVAQRVSEAGYLVVAPDGSCGEGDERLIDSTHYLKAITCSIQTAEGAVKNFGADIALACTPPGQAFSNEWFQSVRHQLVAQDCPVDVLRKHPLANGNPLWWELDELYSSNPEGYIAAIHRYRALEAEVRGEVESGLQQIQRVREKIVRVMGLKTKGPVRRDFLTTMRSWVGVNYESSGEKAIRLFQQLTNPEGSWDALTKALPKIEQHIDAYMREFKVD